MSMTRWQRLTRILTLLSFTSSRQSSTSSMFLVRCSCVFISYGIHYSFEQPRQQASVLASVASCPFCTSAGYIGGLFISMLYNMVDPAAQTKTVRRSNL